MNTEQILQVIDAISQSSLSEFKYEGDGVKFSMKKPGKCWKTAGKSTQETFLKESLGTPNTVFSTETAENLPASSDLLTHTTPGEESGKSFADTSAAEENRENKPQVKGNLVKSPLVGTFYAAPSEDSDSFVTIGDHVEKGQVLAIIEAMKLMNEIESDFAGTITEILVKNGEAVEYGQPLFVIQ